MTVSQGRLNRDRPYSDSRSGLLARVGALLSPLPDRPTAELATRVEIDRIVPKKLGSREAQALLLQAQDLYSNGRERAQSAESRATTLQGAVGVAAGLILTGANFVLDPNKVADHTWRIAFASCLAALLICLVLSGWLASRTILTLFTLARPRAGPILRRTSHEVADANRERAIELIADAHANHYVASFKYAQIRAAGRWFRAALSLLGTLALLLAIYVAVGPAPS